MQSCSLYELAQAVRRFFDAFTTQLTYTLGAVYGEQRKEVQAIIAQMSVKRGHFAGHGCKQAIVHKLFSLSPVHDERMRLDALLAREQADIIQTESFVVHLSSKIRSEPCGSA